MNAATQPGAIRMGWSGLRKTSRPEPGPKLSWESRVRDRIPAFLRSTTLSVFTSAFCLRTPFSKDENLLRIQPQSLFCSPDFVLAFTGHSPRRHGDTDNTQETEP